jgi:hypothetical protein
MASQKNEKIQLPHAVQLMIIKLYRVIFILPARTCTKPTPSKITFFFCPSPIPNCHQRVVCMSAICTFATCFLVSRSIIRFDPLMSPTKPKPTTRSDALSLCCVLPMPNCCYKYTTALCSSSSLGYPTHSKSIREMERMMMRLMRKRSLLQQQAGAAASLFSTQQQHAAADPGVLPGIKIRDSASKVE